MQMFVSVVLILAAILIAGLLAAPLPTASPVAQRSRRNDWND